MLIIILELVLVEQMTENPNQQGFFFFAHTEELVQLTKAHLIRDRLPKTVEEQVNHGAVYIMIQIIKITTLVNVQVVLVA